MNHQSHQKDADINTKKALNFLAKKGYKISKEKLQLSKPMVKYLGYLISKGKKQLPPERKQAICCHKPPESCRQSRGFGEWQDFVVSGFLILDL